MTDEFKPLFEAHITFEHRWRGAVQTQHSQDWKYSAIDGDPVLGKEIFCYLTSYDSSDEKLLERMKEEVAHLQAHYPFIRPVRLKIEKIVYDTKTGRNLVNGIKEKL